MFPNETVRNDVQRRFNQRIQKMPSGCIEFIGKRSNAGYGQLKVVNSVVHAHRVAYVLVNGPIPDGLFVCHHCDNPSCVNIDHLYVGTQQDNINDRTRRLRTADTRGSLHYNAHLTEDKVREIRAEVAKGWSVTSIAKLYGISQSTASEIVSGESWSHVK